MVRQFLKTAAKRSGHGVARQVTPFVLVVAGMRDAGAQPVQRAEILRGIQRQAPDAYQLQDFRQSRFPDSQRVDIKVPDRKIRRAAGRRAAQVAMRQSGKRLQLASHVRKDRAGVYNFKVKSFHFMSDLGLKDDIVVRQQVFGQVAFAQHFA
jgi:hypothetical protein